MWKRESRSGTARFCTISSDYTTVKQTYLEPCFFVFLSQETDRETVHNPRATARGLIPKTAWCVCSTDCQIRLSAGVENFRHDIFFLMSTHFFSHNSRVIYAVHCLPEDTAVHPVFEICTNWPIKGQYVTLPLRNSVDLEGRAMERYSRTGTSTLNAV